MNSIRKAAVLIGVILACNSIGACKQGEDTSKQPADTSVSTVRVRLAWLHQASYVPFHVGVEKGFYAKQRLNVEIVPSGPDLRPITPVAAGEDQFGIEGAASLIQAGAKGVPIAVVGTYLHRSPEVFIARKSDQLSEVKSWKGKRIGLWIGTHVEPLLYAMLSRAGLTKSDVDIVPAKFDISPFLAEGDGRVPIWNAYIYNEAQIPIEREIEIDIVTPESVGVRRVGEGLFTSRRFLRENPEVVERFLAATAEAITYTKEHQEEAIQILTSGKYGTGFDLEHQKNMLRAAAPLMFDQDGQPLRIHPDLWQETVKTSFVDDIPAGLDVSRFLEATHLREASAQ